MTYETSRISKYISSSLIVLLLVLVPVLQTSSNLIQIPTASATGGITLSNVQSTSGSVILPVQQITLSSFNVGTGGNRTLIVGVEANSASVTSITFGGTSLTKKVSSFTNNDAEFWYLTNPSGTGNIVVTLSGSTSVVVGAYAFSGVDQTTPIPTSNATHNASSSSPAISLTTQYANSVVLDSPAIYGGVTLGSPTCTQEWNHNVQNTVTGKITGASSSTIVSSPSTVTCSWTASPNGDLWDDVAIEVKEASSSSTTASTGLLTPVYCAPYGNDSFNTACGGCTGSTFCWQPLVDARTNHPRVPIYDIVNLDNGLPSCTDSHVDISEYQKGTTALKNAGVIVLGYVDTNNTNVSETAVESQIDNYKSCMPSVTGIFFDQMSSDANATHENYYGNLTAYAKGTDGMKYTVGNPGNPTISGYIGKVDNIVIYESHPMPVNLQNDVISGDDKHNFSFIAYDVTSTPSSSTITSDSSYVGLLYVTDNTGCNGLPPSSCAPNQLNPYNTTSTYIGTLATDLDQ